MLHHDLQLRARSHADHLAIEHGSRQYSYARLNRIANCAASELIDRIENRNPVVAILISDPAVQLAVAFGVWKAGMTVLILDFNDPVARLERVLHDAGAELVVTGPDCSKLASRLIEKFLVFNPELCGCQEGEIDICSDPSRAAAIVYTSGSTGRPKGVVRTHQNMLLNLRQRTCFDIRSTDRVSMMLPLSFGWGLHSSLVTLLSGAALISFAPATEGIAPFARWLCEKKITFLMPPIAYLRSFLSTLQSELDTHSCRCVVLGADSVHRADVARIRSVFGARCQLIRAYGLTEAGHVTCYHIDPAIPVGGPLPLGYAVDDVEVRIVDENGRARAAGENGEIAVVSSNLPPGYWNDPVLSQQRYIKLSDGTGRRMFLTGDIGSIQEDGLIYLHGRKDFQFKIHGYRVNLSEIDEVLNSIEGVAEAAAIVTDDVRTGERRITAFVKLSNQSVLTDREFRRMAAEGLPRYMVPERTKFVDALPRTSSGKIDRAALLDMIENPTGA